MTTTATKSRPTLFSGPMVRAILNGTKTQTRRVVNPQPPEENCLPAHIDASTIKDDPDVGKWQWYAMDGNLPDWPVGEKFSCPYGVPGDELWVREEHYRFGHWEPVPGVRTKSGRHQKWRFVGDSDEVLFERPSGLTRSMNAPYQSRPGWYKRLARFMPRWASRITLEVTGVRIQRLNDISEADAYAEGVTIPPEQSFASNGNPHLRNEARCQFVKLWESINGPGSWDENPPVWVVEFKRKLTP